MSLFRIKIGPKGDWRFGLTRASAEKLVRRARAKGLAAVIRPENPNPFKRLERRHGLRRTSGDNDGRGVHSATSWHYAKAPWGGVRAYDYGTSVNSFKQLRAAAEECRKTAWAWREVFGPFPWYIKNGKVYSGQFPEHGDHLHVAR